MKCLIRWAVSPLLLLIFSASSYASEVIRLANGEWPPYNSKQLMHFGIASRIITEAFAIQDMQVDYRFAPWKRGMVMAQTGKLDGTGVWRHRADLEDNFYYSEPVMESGAVFFHLKSFSFDWKNFEDLKGIKIGGTIGYSYSEEFDNAEKSLEYRIDRTSSDKKNLRMLLEGRINIFPITKEVGYYLLQTDFKNKESASITHHSKIITPKNKRTLHLLLSRKDERNIYRMKMFNQGLNKLKKSGRYNQYFKDFEQGRYFVENNYP